MKTRKGCFFSIIVTVYNCEKYIIETLQSVDEQTFKDYEVVIIDDCSSDKTPEYIGCFIENKANWFLYRNKSNHGVASSRNIGFDHAKGEYIALLDGDDVWEAHKLKIQHDTLIRENIDMCYSSYSFINAKSYLINYTYYTQSKATYKALLKENFIGCSTVVFTSDLCKKYLMSNEIAHEDYAFWLLLLKQGYKASGIIEPLVRYRIHNQGRSYNKVLAAINRFKLYRTHEDLNIFKSTFYFIYYCYRAIIKYWNIKMKGLK